MFALFLVFAAFVVGALFLSLRPGQRDGIVVPPIKPLREQQFKNGAVKVWFDIEPPGPAWRRLSMYDQTIVGERYHAEAFNGFLQGANRSIEIVHQPDNPHDSNALAVFGGWTSRGKSHRELIGYLTEEYAQAFADLRPTDLPLIAHPATYYDENPFFDFKIAIYEPSVRSGYWAESGLEPPAQIPNHTYSMI